MTHAWMTWRTRSIQGIFSEGTDDTIPFRKRININPRHLDRDCDYIAHLLGEYETIISECMDSGNYSNAVTLLLSIRDSLTRHFVEDEHYTYFDDCTVRNMCVRT